MSGERQVVFISGEAGVGKTTLVDAFLAQLHDRLDIRISSGHCVEQYGPGEAYMPLLEAIVRLCRGPSRERRIADLKQYAPSLLAQLPGLLDAEEHARLLACVQGTSRERMLREMVQAAELFTARRGLVLVLEDVHWSDVSTLEWLACIARRREPTKLLILGTYRPTETMNTSHPLRGVVQDLLAHRRDQGHQKGPQKAPHPPSRLRAASRHHYQHRGLLLVHSGPSPPHFVGGMTWGRGRPARKRV